MVLPPSATQTERLRHLESPSEVSPTPSDCRGCRRRVSRSTHTIADCASLSRPATSPRVTSPSMRTRVTRSVDRQPCLSRHSSCNIGRSVIVCFPVDSDSPQVTKSGVVCVFVGTPSSRVNILLLMSVIYYHPMKKYTTDISSSKYHIFTSYVMQSYSFSLLPSSPLSPSQCLYTSHT